MADGWNMKYNFERPAIAASAISAVMPCRQAEGRLVEEVNSLACWLQAQKREYEIIVVDDGSTDGGRAVGEDLAKSNSRVRCLGHEKPAGYGAALRTGLAAARHPLVLTMPAGAGYRAEDVGPLLDLIDKVDLVCCRRPSRPWLKSRLVSWLISLAFGPRLKDPACPFRLYRRSIFARIPIQSNSSFANVEILAKANFLGCLMNDPEVEVNCETAVGSQAQPAAGPSVMSDFFRVFRKPDFGPAKLDASSGPGTL